MKYVRAILLFSLLAFSGCGDTVESLADDADRRNEILKACADMGTDSLDNELCKLAAKAQVEAAKRSITGAFK
jgi:hypothetical protein